MEVAWAGRWVSAVTTPLFSAADLDGLQAVPRAQSAPASG